MINLSIRNYQITIAGLDCTEALLSFRGSDSKLDQSGLITFTGEIVLGKPIGFESLDDRKNTRWSRGKAISVRLADQSGTLQPSPRGSELFILDASFDLKTRKLTLRVGDIFALMDFKEGKGDVSGICLGTSTARTALINTLLTAAGCPALSGSIPGFLNSPTPRLLEGNYLQQAGAIAAAAGYFLWVDDGTPTASAINTVPTSALLSIDLTEQGAIYDRLQGEQPSQRISVAGKAIYVKQTGDTTEISSTELGTALLAGAKSDAQIIIKSTYTIDSFKRSSKTRKIQTFIQEPLGVLFPDDTRYAGVTALVDSSYQLETYQYETSSPIAGTSGSTKCQQGNQGRLKTHTVAISRPLGVVLREVYATYPETVELTNKTDLTLSEQTTTSYEYDVGLVGRVTKIEDEDAQPSELEKVGTGTRITITKRQAIGSLIPSEFAYDTSRPQVVSPVEMVNSELQINYWRERNLGEWTEREQLYKSLATVQPTIVEFIREQYAKDGLYPDPRDLVRLISTTDQTTVSNSGQAQPPAADTYPAPFTTQEVTVKGRANFPVDAITPYRQRTKELSFEYLSTVSSGTPAIGVAQAEAERLAKIWGVILWGRYKGATLTTSLEDGWLDYRPLSRADVVESDGVAAYLADGFAIAMSDRRCVVSFDGMLLGFTDAGNIETITPIYQQTDEGQFALGFAVGVNDRDYDLTPITAAGQFALGFAIRPQSDMFGEFALGFSFLGQSNPEQGRYALGQSSDGIGSIDWDGLSESQWENSLTVGQWGNLGWFVAHL
jgi:hypothetical protein